MTRNNRGNRNRRIPIVGRNGLGNQNTTRPARIGRRAAMEPSEMESRLVRGDPDPTPTPDRAVFVRSLLGLFSQFAGSTTSAQISASTILIYENQAATGSASTTASRFNEMRLKRVELWDTAANEATDTPLTLTVQTSGGGDGAVFRDFGTPGERRAHIAVIPNFALRQRWFTSSDTTNLITVASPGSQIVRLTLELR